MDGNGGVYEKPLEILSSVNIFLKIIIIIKKAVFLCDLCTFLVSLTQVMKALGKSLLCLLSPTPHPDMPVKPTA